VASMASRCQKETRHTSSKARSTKQAAEHPRPIAHQTRQNDERMQKRKPHDSWILNMLWQKQPHCLRRCAAQTHL
jgi:hypothetical protein